MSNLRRAVSDTESESESESENEGTKTKVNRRLSEVAEEDEVGKLVDSEAEELLSEEETKGNHDGKPQKPSKQQQQQQQDEEEDEIESESESESDQERKPVPQPRSRVAKKGSRLRGAVKVPLVTQSFSVKRVRDANGANGLKGNAATEEPLVKKTRHAAPKDDKPRSEAEKMPLSPGKSPSKRERKMEQAGRGSGRGSAKPDKALPTAGASVASKVDNAKIQAAGRKRKASSPPASSARQQQAQKLDGDKSPPKTKKPFSWSSAVEESLVSELHEDCLNGLVIPATKVDPYWEKLLKRLPLEEDLTGMQLCDKVKRMRQRYFTLRERADLDGAKFKSPHEGKMYELWTDIWGLARKASQPAVDVEHSEDESAETATTTAPRESSKRAGRQGNWEANKDVPAKRNSEASNGAETQERVETLISDDEIEEEEIELTQREPASLSQINASSKVTLEPVVTPFLSKPRLEHTPMPLREGKSRLVKRVEEVVSDRHAEECPATDDEGKGDVVSSADHVKRFKDDMIRFFQELRGSFFPGIEEQKNGSSTGGLGDLAHAGSVFVSGVLEGLGVGSGTAAGRELQKKWRELKIQELALVSKRLHLLQEHCRLQQEELKLQNYGLDD